MIYLISTPSPGNMGYWMTRQVDEKIADDIAAMLTKGGEKVYRVNWFIHWLQGNGYYKLATCLAVKYGKIWSNESL